MTSSIILMGGLTAAPTAPSGHRTVVFWWKTSKSTGKMLSPKKYSHVPIIDNPLMNEKTQMSIFIRSAVEDAQDDYLKGLIENNLSKTEFTDIELNLTSVMNDYFAAKKTGGRLDGDSIEEWFISDMLELLQVAVEGKIGNTDPEKVASIVIGYRDKYKKLASGAVKYPQIVAENLLTNIRKVTVDSPVKEKLIARLEPMTKVVTAESEGLI